MENLLNPFVVKTIQSSDNEILEKQLSDYLDIIKNHKMNNIAFSTCFRDSTLYYSVLIISEDLKKERINLKALDFYDAEFPYIILDKYGCLVEKFNNHADFSSYFEIFKLNRCDFYSKDFSNNLYTVGHAITTLSDINFINDFKNKYNNPTNLYLNK